MKFWDFTERFWAAVLVALAVSVLSIIAVVTCADHHVRRYYVGEPQANEAEAGVTCVYADDTWEADGRVYCSTDPQKTLDFTRAANAQLEATRGH